MHVYGGVRHSFTNATPEGRDIAGLAYDRFAAEHTRESVLALLNRTLRPWAAGWGIVGGVRRGRDRAA